MCPMMKGSQLNNMFLVVLAPALFSMKPRIEELKQGEIREAPPETQYLFVVAKDMFRTFRTCKVVSHNETTETPTQIIAERTTSHADTTRSFFSLSDLQNASPDVRFSR